MTKNKNIQEYINGLVNKSSVFWLGLNNYVSKIESKHECPACKKELEGKFYCENCNSQDKLEGEITDLKEFSNLKGINASNNQFTNLDFLDTLTNKDKLQSLNLFGNQIKEVDFAELFTNFPNLEKINLSGNPLSAKNLDKLSGEQFGKLIEGIKEQKIRINSFKGTILMDLLEHAQKLTSQGNNSHQQNAQYLKTLIQGNSPKSTEKQPKNGNNTPLLVGGLVIFGVSVLAVGYWWGKRKGQELES